MKRRGNGEGSIYQDASRNRWVAAVSVNGRRIKRTAKTQREARQLRDELLRNQALKSRVSRSPQTVSALLDDWLEHRVAVQVEVAATSETKRWAAEHIRRQLGSVRLRELDYVVVEEALKKMAGNPLNLSQASIAKIRSNLSQACSWGVRRGVLVSNPVPIAEMPKTKKTRPRVALTEAEAVRLHHEMENESLHALWAILLGCGLRSGEARALHWSDWDAEAHRLAVRRSIRIESGKRLAGFRMKTEASKRTLALPEYVSRALAKHRAKMEAEARDIVSGPIFTTSSGSLIDDSNLRRRLHILCERAGVRETSIHELRHTCASLLADKGTPVEKISDVLGHQSVRTTSDTYRHVIGASVDGLVGTVDAVYGNGRDG